MLKYLISVLGGQAVGEAREAPADAVVLDELDGTLSRRRPRFCRYADDGNISVCNRRVGARVPANVSRWRTS